MKNALILTFVIASSFSVTANEHSQDWGYEGLTGPEHWGSLSPDYALCQTGKNQSPVNIRNVLKTNQNKLLLNFKAGRQQIINNGHTIQVNMVGGNSMKLDDKIFTLQQFHFHAPSENEIDGKNYPLEGHFVYKDETGSLAVLALMFQDGNENSELAKVLQKLPARVSQSASLKQEVDIKAMLPENLAFYRFSGSLTTPPCSEGVVWMVLEEPVSASHEQIERFKDVLHNANNRPTQPLNGRVIIN
ncbi:carbonic anhydrase [Enterobacter ludwigii]|uniref:carbonic anhydrase n=1 Tax=Enterobacter ludwigii TaxID=299767 RepID=UPI00159C1E62|nr:carbonic anhydrase [Enterobacter ludwigii]QLA06964.1 carbonic anhydrase [Enterobacter ludwigii]